MSILFPKSKKRTAFPMLRRCSIIGAFAFLAIASACSRVSDAKDSDGPLKIVATTGMIADALTRIAGDKATVTALMGPGVDPHLYKATQGDLRLLTEADLIFYNGLHLEGKMGEVLQKLSKTRKVVALAEAIPQELLLHSDAKANVFDPHVWFDVSLWRRVVRQAGATLAELDAANAEYYRANTDTFLAELDDLHQWVTQEIASIPQEGRVLITAHDAFGYFGKAYGIEVRGLQGISTASEYGLRDISELVSFLTDRKIKAVFVESSVPAKSLEAVVEGCTRRGHPIKIGGSLYSDAMGETGSPEGNYPGMVRANVTTIVHALK
jgi:manganese/zinc/iron transport system substrate-binding protein